MKVALIGPSAPLRGGIARYNDALAQELKHRGHQVLLVSFRRLYPKLLFPGTSERDPSLPAGTALSLLDPVAPWTWWKSARAVIVFAPAVAVLHWWHPFFFGLARSMARALARAGIPTLALCHNVLPHERLPAQKWLVRTGLCHFRHALVHSHVLEQEFKALLPEVAATWCFHPIVVAAPGQGCSDRRPCQEGTPVILFFGYVRPYKGLAVLLDAFALLCRQLPARLRIAGEFYEPVEPYLDQIRRLGIESRVEVENRFIPESEVGRYFEMADVVVLPYLSATQSGIIPLAFGHGVPVIATRTGGLDEVVQSGQTGFVVPPGNAERLAEALRIFFEQGKAAAFRNNIRRFSKLLNWSGPISCIESLSQTHEK